MIDAAAADIIPPSVRGRLFGVLMILGIMFVAVNPYIAGIMHDSTGGYPWVYLIIVLTGAAMAFMLPAKKKIA